MITNGMLELLREENFAVDPIVLVDTHWPDLFETTGILWPGTDIFLDTSFLIPFQPRSFATVSSSLPLGRSLVRKKPRRLPRNKDPPLRHHAKRRESSLLMMINPRPGLRQVVFHSELFLFLCTAYLPASFINHI